MTVLLALIETRFDVVIAVFCGVGTHAAMDRVSATTTAVQGIGLNTFGVGQCIWREGT